MITIFKSTRVMMVWECIRDMVAYRKQQCGCLKFEFDNIIINPDWLQYQAEIEVCLGHWGAITSNLNQINTKVFGA
jgi:hypothetical protein